MKHSILTTHPHLVSEWNYDKNALLPKDVTFGSNKSIWWVCDKKHEWNVSVNERSRGRGCPYCANKKVSQENSLIITHPQLAKEWHQTKNITLPIQVTFGSTKKIWWIGECGHEWDATISNRSIVKTGCSYCHGRKVDSTNSLSSQAPLIAAEWHPTKNIISSDQIHFKSGKKAWWLGVCGHEWNSVVYHRTNGVGCPKCKESKGEKQITKTLKQLGVKFEREYKTSKCKHINMLSFDFAVYKDCLKLIEYNGGQHYFDVPYFGGRASLENNKIRDRIKYDFCKNNKIPLLVIPYWQFNEIDYLISNFL